MPLLLGFDTGGTYTDAVLYHPAKGVLAAAKSLTTKHDLSIGLRGALEKILPEAQEPIAMVSLSTTLATNALVEGQGSPICLLLIGYEKQALERAGLRQALGADPVVFVAGGHSPMGDEQAPLDRETVAAAIRQYAPKVASFAVSGYFSVRNPAHEIAVRQMVREMVGLPVTCGHELTSKLDAPRRALTTALNARLIPQLQQLIEAVGVILAEKKIGAPLMVVKGDGSLIAAEIALNCPVETILSGPAASLVGAYHLSGAGDVVVSDMGGTTTDVALLADGRPVLDRDGATVGGWRTMVEAVAVHSFGLGGDSELRFAEGGHLVLGPRRAVPLALLAMEHPKILERMERQLLRSDRVGYDAQFALRLRRLDTRETSLTPPQLKVWQALETGPAALADIVDGPTTQRALDKLLDRGLVTLSAFTPSDAAHGLGLQSHWRAAAAELGAQLWLRRLDAVGGERLDGVEGFCRRVIEQAVRQSVDAILTTTLDESEGMRREDWGALGRLMVARTAEGRAPSSPLIDLGLKLKRPLVAIGAPVGAYYPAIAERLGTELIVPPHAGVCNAVGAVAGGVLKRVEALITEPSGGLFRVHLSDGIADFGKLEAAADHAAAQVAARALAEAKAAGAGEIELKRERQDKIVDGGGGLKIFVESRIAAIAFGRPRLAAAE